MTTFRDSSTSWTETASSCLGRNPFDAIPLRRSNRVNTYRYRVAACLRLLCYRYRYGQRMETATRRKRLRRKRGEPTEGAYYRLTPEVKAAIDAYSEEYDVATWAVVEAAIRAFDPARSELPELAALAAATPPDDLFSVPDLTERRSA